MYKEKLFDYGDSKFKVIISDELIIDRNTNHPVQVKVNPDDYHDSVQTVHIYISELTKLVLVNGLSHAVLTQYDNFVRDARPDDPQTTSNDYFQSIDSLLLVSAVFVQDVFTYLRKHKYRINDELYIKRYK